MAEEGLTIQNLFSHAALKFPQKVALQIKQDAQWRQFTYREIELSSLKIGAFLIKEGLKSGECAGIILENRPEWAVIYLGIVRAGLTCVPLDPQLTAGEIKNLILDSQAKVIFTSPDIFTNKIERNIDGGLAKFVVLDAPDFSRINSAPTDNILWPRICEEDIASLIYTSGTTASPKGVLLTHKNICSNFISLQKLNLLFASDNLLAILPLHHTYAFMVTLLVPLLLGAKVTYAQTFKPQDLNVIIQEAGVTILVGVPQLFSLLHQAISVRIKKVPALLRPLVLVFIRGKVRQHLGESLRMLVSGGARLSPEIGRNLNRLGLKIIEGYGLSETSPVVTLNPPRKIKFGSVGIPIPDVQLKINNPDKTGIGEVLVKGANVMPGYFKRPDLTAQVIKEGWFHSGDLGYLDKEGYLFLTGRVKEVIVLSSGKNIYPEELEEYYRQSPYIKELCIILKKEEKFGRRQEILYAVVVPELEYFRQRNEADISGKIRWELENLGKNTPSYQHIMGFKVIKEELPRTALKKVKRYLVREKYLKETLEPDIREAVIFSEEDSQTLNRDMALKIIDYLSSELKKPVSLASHLEIDLGIDSLTRVELGLGLEARLNLKIPDALLYGASTVREVILKIQNLMERPEDLAYRREVRQKSWGEILREPLDEKMRKKIRLQTDSLDNLLTWLAKIIFLFIFRIFWRLKVKGREFLPEQGPYLICPNHASYLDGFTIFSSLPSRKAVKAFFLGYSQIFEHPLVSWAAKTARLIPLDPNLRLTEAMQAVSWCLRQKKIVCIFPEGRRSVDENIQEFKKGVGILIKELDIPVIPVYIKGSHYSWPRTSRLPRFYPLKVIFGQAVSLKELIKSGKDEPVSDDYEAIARGLRKEVLKLGC